MRWIAIAALAAAATAWPLSCATAKERPSAAAPAEAPAQTGSRFYPQDVEGGVSGNYPFNNQIRKLRDPLNANGGK